MLRHSRTPWILLAALTLAHLLFLANFVRPAFSGPDADGYYAQARMLVLEGRPDFQPESPVQHLGVHWLEKEDGRFISRYPPGLSIVVGAVWKLLGRDTSLYVNPVLAALTLPLVFLLCRPYSGNWLALGGAVVQAVSPAANRHALEADSHTLTTLCLVGGLFLLDRWGRRGGRGTALAAGFVLAYIPMVRFAEAAAALGVIAFLVLIWRRPERRSELPLVIAGALVPTLALTAHNQYHFGAFWRTAYALTGESNLSLAYLIRNWSVYSQTLLTSGVGYFIPPAVVGLALMLRERQARPFAVATGLIAGGITLLYCCYYFASFGSPVTVRFLLPTLPLYLPPALYALRVLLPAGTLGPAAAILLFLQISVGQPPRTYQLHEEAEAADRSVAAIEGLEAVIPPGAVIFGDYRLHDQLNFTGQWKLADAELLLRPSRPRRRPRPSAPKEPSPRQRGKADDLRSRYTDLSEPERVRAVLHDAESWAGDDAVFLVLASGAEERLPDLPAAYALATAGQIEFQAIAPNPTPGPPRRPASPFGLTSEPLTIYRITPANPSGRLQ